MCRTLTILACLLGLTALVMAGPTRAEELRKIALQTPLILTDADGKTVSTEKYRGKFLLIYFGYTSCADLCPTGLSIMSEALSELGPAADYVQPIFVTVDPERDRGEILRSFPAAFDKRMIGLGGSEAQIATVASALGVAYKKIAQGISGEYEITHSAEYILIDRDGAKGSAMAAAAPYEIDVAIVARLKAAGIDLSHNSSVTGFR